MRMLTAGLLLAPCAPGHASLGAAPSDFGVTRSATRARILAAAAATSYSVNETTLPSGTVIREYVASGGNVFAVSWNGPLMPDLRTLLGRHFDTLTSETAKSPKAGHNRVHIVRPEVVIVSGGHMRAYTGRAWIANDFPPGITAADID
ncbi:MAG TPA: DUF2844 domain-containing protein [Telluria sp.]|nr:DUF2844 domain-containing protein [Telluria sp.]